MLSSLLLVAGVVLVVEGLYQPYCTPCRGEKCNVEPEGCKYGVVTICGHKACARGPGERCAHRGPHNHIRGKCADELTCDNCGYCRGCSLRSLFSGIKDCYYSDPMCLSSRMK